MEKFFTLDGKILAVNQDCSTTVFATVTNAIVANPLCVLKARELYENVSFNGREEQWYQNTRYRIYNSTGTLVEQLMVGNWFVRDFISPRNTNTLLCEFVDPMGKIVPQNFAESTNEKRITNVFLKIREMNNYESALNYSLHEENMLLKQQLIKLREKLGLQ